MAPYLFDLRGAYLGKGFPRRIFLFFLGVAFLNLAAGCTHIRYESEGFIPLYLGQRENHRHKVEIGGVKEFYLWGRIHPDDHVFIDEEFYNQGLLSVGEIEVTQFQTLNQFLTAFFSLGFYIPISYKITAKGAKEGD